MSFVSCLRLPPQKFSADNERKSRIFSVDELTKARCEIVSKEALPERNLQSQAKEWKIEANQFPSVVFSEYTNNLSAPPVINHLPFVDYEIEGGDLCQKLLGSSKAGLPALPHSRYGVFFQIAGPSLRIFMSAPKENLPYQRLTSSISLSDKLTAVPIGGYDISQGLVRKRKNIDDVETHILDFFENDNQPYQTKEEGPVVHYIREGASDVFIPSLNESFKDFGYSQKEDVFPKSYFDGVWHLGVTAVSAEPLFSQNIPFIGSGLNFSGDSHMGGTDGQKIYFQFGTHYLRALNEDYRKQSEDLDLPRPAEAESLSLPIKHVDYLNSGAAARSLKGWGLSESKDRRTPLQERRYVQIDFSGVDHFFGKFLRKAIQHYGLTISKTHFITVKEIRFADDYFDFVVDDGNGEYRFSFRREKPSTYQAFKMTEDDRRKFEYFFVHDQRVFNEVVDSFKEDIEENILLKRIHPDSNGQIPLYFSNITPKDEKFRNIGREAVSLWNQALKKAGLSIELTINEEKDVNIGDNRYHILNIPRERDQAYIGVAQTYIDHTTGEVLSTTSNTIISDIVEYLRFLAINASYERYGLSPRLSGGGALRNGGALSHYSGGEGSNSLFSSSFLDSLLFMDKISRLLSIRPSVEIPQSKAAMDDFLKVAHVKRQSKIKQLEASPSLEDLAANENLNFIFGSRKNQNQWIQNFKTAYALNTGQLIKKGQPMDQLYSGAEGAANQMAGMNFAVRGSRLEKMINEVCYFIPHPTDFKLEFKESIEKCIEKIYPLYALGTMVHEMGHSLFSLQHNFAGSVDKANFNEEGAYTLSHLKPYLNYKNAEGQTKNIQELFPQVSSTVMEYINFSDGEQYTPGPYDVSAVQFLYSKKEGSSSSIEDSLKDHSFLVCSDQRAGRSTFCQRFDAGSSPEEIAMNEVQNLFESLDTYFYQQDRVLGGAALRVERAVARLMTIYYDWRSRYDTVISKYMRMKPENITAFQIRYIISQIIIKANSPAASKEDREFLQFYRARNLIYHALTYLAFLPNHYCILKKSPNLLAAESHSNKDVKALLELSRVIRAGWQEGSDVLPSSSEDLTSCFDGDGSGEPHPMVAKYISEQHPGFFLEGETGHLLYSSPSPKQDPYLELGRHYFREHSGAFIPRLAAFLALSATELFFPRRALSFDPPGVLPSPTAVMMNEPDIKHALERLMLARLTRGAFYSKVDFFESLKGISLEDLTPEKSAEILFEFPPIGETDPLFRDILIEPEVLAKNSRFSGEGRFFKTDFYQNFEEERILLYYFSELYSFGHLISGGYFSEEIADRALGFFDNLDIRHSLTSSLLYEKSRSFRFYKKLPTFTMTNYFESGSLTIMNHDFDNSPGALLLKALALGSVRSLFGDRHQRSLFMQYEKPGRKLSISFGSILLTYLHNLMMNNQGNRLGRFHFMYAYMLALGFLESYESLIATMDINKAGSIDERASYPLEKLVGVVSHLFRMRLCETDVGHLIAEKKQIDANIRRQNKKSFNWDEKMKEHGGNMLSEGFKKDFNETLDQTMADVDGGRRETLREQIQEACHEDVRSRKKGKMQVLYRNNQLKLNVERSTWDNTDFLRPDDGSAVSNALKTLVGKHFNRWQAERLGFYTDLEIKAIQDNLGPMGIEEIQTAMRNIFKHFPLHTDGGVPNDKAALKKLIQSLRQMLIDVIPKLMLMYSDDRNFVREMMFMVSQIYTPCTSRRVPLHICLLQVERVIGYYFTNAPYFSNPRVEQAFAEKVNNSEPIEGGIPINYFMDVEKLYDNEDLMVSWEPFNAMVIWEWLYYELGWDKISASVEELKAQRELIFSLLPIVRFNYIGSGNRHLTDSDWKISSPQSKNLKFKEN